MKYLVSVHNGGGSASEAASPEWSTLVASVEEAEALVEELNNAIGRDPYHEHTAWAQYMELAFVPVPVNLAGDELWHWVQGQTCCLTRDEDEDSE